MEPQLVDVYRAQVAPDHVIQQLREIDPRCELVYIGGGKWWLGLVDTLRHVEVVKAGRRLGEALWEEGGATWPTLRLMQLKEQGFRKVDLPLERWPREPLWGFVVFWFGKQDFVYRHWPTSDAGWDREYRTHVPDSKPGEELLAAKKLLDIAHAERKTIMRRMQRGALVPVA